MSIVNVWINGAYFKLSLTVIQAFDKKSRIQIIFIADMDCDSNTRLQVQYSGHKCHSIIRLLIFQQFDVSDNWASGIGIHIVVELKTKPRNSKIYLATCRDTIT